MVKRQKCNFCIFQRAKINYEADNDVDLRVNTKYDQEGEHEIVSCEKAIHKLNFKTKRP